MRSIPALLLILPAMAGGTAPTFSRQVAPILFAHCAKCHQPGEIAAPVSFLSYDKARSWAKAIGEKVLLREMPPWPPDPGASVPFRNDARLSDGDIHTIAAWVAAGAPKGGDADPQSPEVAKGWLHPKGIPPDAVIVLPESELPAEGRVPYVTRLVKVPFEEDKWISAIQVRPSNGAVVHHMAITEVQAVQRFGPDLSPLAALARQVGFQNELIVRQPAVAAPGNSAIPDMLAIYTPGTSFEMYGDGAAKLLKAGKDLYLDFNIHYQATGKPEKDQSSLALWFQPQPPKHQLFRVNGAGSSLLANGQEMLIDAPQEKAEGNSAAIPPIPPGARKFEVTGMTAYTQPVVIYQFHPHAHLRARDFTYTVVYDDGREQTVLSVPKYNPHWQLAYDLKTPLELPAGSKLVVTVDYDNSVNNANNPAPDKEVRFLARGNQSWDEMFSPFIQYAVNGSEPLDIVEVVGCLEKSATGAWGLMHAGEPVVSNTEATSSVALKVDADRELRDGRYRLVGVRFFSPETRKTEKVAVKGVLIGGGGGGRRINVTSLQTVSEHRVETSLDTARKSACATFR
jgi:mono/diheme cytochrome c family protein